MTLILTRSDLAPLVDMAATVQAVEQAMGDVARGLAVQPGSALMRLPDRDAGFIPMAAASATDGLASVKLLADIPGNLDRGLATQRSSLTLVSALTGETLALLDGAVPTRTRTAAASAVGTRHLARPDSRSLGLIGAGALAVAHVEAMLNVLPALDTVTFWTRRDTTADAFTRGVARHGLLVKRLDSPRAVAETADVLCTLTPSVTPVLQGAWLRPGQHVNAVGARPRPDHRELDTEVVQRSRVLVDSLAVARAKAGDLVIPVSEGAFDFADVVGELGQVIAGQLDGRGGTDDVTVYKSVGIGLQDLAVGRLLWQAARAAGRGVDVDLSA